jgi:hypothetical protein
MAGTSGSKRKRHPHPADRTDYMVTVVEFSTLREADDAFERWLTEHNLTRDAINPRDLRIDTGRGEGGDVRRYRVHLDVIRASEPPA